MKEKILQGQRKVPKNELIGGHSSTINNSNTDFAVEILSNNADGKKMFFLLNNFQTVIFLNIKKVHYFQTHGMMNKFSIVS